MRHPSLFLVPVVNLARGARAEVDSVWSAESGYEATRAIDGRSDTRCATKDDKASLTLTWEKPVRMAEVRLSEYSPGGGRYRAKRFTVQVPDGDGWKTVASGDGVGASARVRFAPETADRLRLSFEGDGPVSLWEVRVSGE